MLVVSIPKADTAAVLVDKAAKCLAMHVGSLLYLDNNHAFAVPAFVIVSCVVNLNKKMIGWMVGVRVKI